MGAGHCVVRLVACLVGRECARESNVVIYVRHVESIESIEPTPLCDHFSYLLLVQWFMLPLP